MEYHYEDADISKELGRLARRFEEVRDESVRFLHEAHGGFPPDGWEECLPVSAYGDWRY